MLQQAVHKVRSEMDQNANNPFIQVIGGFLLQYLEGNPSAAEKILTEGKTVGNSLYAMRKAAEDRSAEAIKAAKAARKQEFCAVLSDAEGYEIVLKYFGIEGGSTETATIPTKKAGADFDIKLEDLI